METSNLSGSALLAQKQQEEERRKAMLKIIEQSIAGVAPVTNQEVAQTRSPEVQQAMTEYKAASKQHQETSARISAAAPDYLDQVFSYNAQVQQQLEADKTIKLQQTDYQSRVAQAALPEQQRAVDRYKAVVTDEASTDRYTTLQNSVKEQQDKIAATEQEYREGNIFQKAFAHMKLTAFRQTLDKRQAALDYETRNRIQATQVLGQDLAAAQTTAGVVYAQEGIQIQQKAAASEILLDNFAKQRANLQTTVSELSAIHGLSSANSKALADQLQVLNSQKIADTQSYINVLSLMQQRNQVEMSNEQIRRLQADKRGQEFWSKSVWPAFQATNENFKDLDAEAVLNMSPDVRAKLGLDVPLAAFTQMYMHGAAAPYSGVQLAMQANQNLTPMQQSLLSMAPTVVDSYNTRMRENYISAQVAKGRSQEDVEGELTLSTSGDFKALQQQLLNPDDVNDWNKIDNLMRTEMNNMNKDSTLAFKSGSVKFPSLEEALVSPEIQQQMDKLVPEDVKQFLKEGGLSEVNTRIQKYEDLQAMEKQVVAKQLSALQTLPSGALAPNQDIAGAMANIKKSSQALAAHMRIQREAVMRLQNPLIQNVKVQAPRVGLGAAGTQVVDYENPGQLQTRLETEFLRQYSNLVTPIGAYNARIDPVPQVGLTQRRKL